MLTETGRIIAVDPDSLWVETLRRSTCGSCSANKACGHGIMNAVSDGKRSLVRVLPGEYDIARCAIDDKVRISIPEDTLLKGSFIAYMMPLLCMLLGAMLSVQWLATISQDAAAAVGSVLGLMVGVLLLRWHAVKHADDPSYQPILIEVLSSCTDISPVAVLPSTSHSR